MVALPLEGQQVNGQSIVLDPGWGFRATTALTLAAGSAFVMWLGEQISERGIGNGISLLIFASIADRFWPAVHQTWRRVVDDRLSPVQAIFLDRKSTRLNSSHRT